MTRLPRFSRWAALLLPLLLCAAAHAAEPAAPEALPEGALLRLGTTRLRHDGPITCVDFAPDGQTVATGGKDAVVRLWDRATGKELRQFPMPYMPDSKVPLLPNDLRFSADGQLLAAVGQTGLTGGVLVWETATGKALWAPYTSGAVAPTLRWIGNGRRLLVALDGWLWDWEPAGDKARELPAPRGPLARALSPDGKLLATATEKEKLLRLWDTESGKEIQQMLLPAQASALGSRARTALAFSPDGKLLALSAGSAGLTLWAVNGGKLLQELPSAAPATLLQSFAFSPNGRFIAAAAIDGTVRVLGLTSGREIHALDRGGRKIAASTLAFSPDGKTLACGGPEQALRLCNLEANREDPSLPGHAAAVRQMLFTPDGKMLITAAEDGNLRSWDTVKGTQIDTVNDGTLWPDGLVAGADGTIFVGTKTGQLLVWQTGRRKELRRIPALGLTTLSPNGKTLAVAQPHGVRLLDVGTMAEIRVLAAPSLAATHLAFTADSQRLVAISPGPKVWVWDLGLGRLLRQLGFERAQTMSSLPVVSPNGRLVAGVVSEQVHVWETMTGRIRTTWPCPKDGAAPVLAFSPEGRYLAIGGEKQFWLRDLLTGKETDPLTGHRGAVRAFAFSPDGQRLATGGSDTTVLVWDLAHIRPALPEPVANADPKEVEAWWNDLIDGDGTKVQAAIAALTAAPGPALALLKERLRPMVTDRTPERARRLIEELDDAKFAVRERAMQELENLGEDIAPLLRQELDKKPSLEVTRRLDDLLKRLKGEAPAPDLRVQRALEALEHINNPEARQLLETLAKGSADAWLTRDAQATLHRLASRKPKEN